MKVSNAKSVMKRHEILKHGRCCAPDRPQDCPGLPGRVRIAARPTLKKRNVLSERDYRNTDDEGFSKMDSRILAEIPDDYLADLQTRYGPETGPYLRAQHEWQRRLTMRVVRSSIWASVIGGVLGIIGVILGVILGWWIAQP